MTTSAAATLSTTSIITPREQEVLHMIAHEHSTKQIAQQLYISYETAHSHRKNLLRKLDVGNAAGLVRKGFELGILQLGMRYANHDSCMVKYA